MKYDLKNLFFDEPLKRWHFEEIVKVSKLSRERANHQIRQLLKDNFITRTKKKGKMPYYTANAESETFRQEKRLHGLLIIEKSGLFGHLNSLKEIETAILFGSFSRGDWGKSSDIDLFIYGSDKSFNKPEFEKKLKREIQVFCYKDRDKIKKELDPKLIPNIIKGFNIKESLNPFEVTVNA